MQPTSSIVSLGFLASAALAAANNGGTQFPDFVALAKRAVTETEYQCHANCGYTIQDASAEGYCDDAEWNKLLEACLQCAIETDIWGDYGDYVVKVAEPCGIDATPATTPATPIPTSGASANWVPQFVIVGAIAGAIVNMM
ncbi:hypothetical protein GMORB2_2756 [Geosmithia morbida]|uniref:Uncharacterized protein n=1 Tax=Geosmithia morbida TaxID=1094350 RepID=A0A9P5CZP9_9HYPO|nr:uncharacterized protein GMORB2_2756 [Geosmithia morbida]KAF4120752.1 hypothetical protein GMORB2_2756 [Geosmithia morbida]